MERTCHKCGVSEGIGDRELRPYGVDGHPICFGCAFASPDAEVRTEAEFKRRLDAIDGPVVLTPDGPKPLGDES